MTSNIRIDQSVVYLHPVVNQANEEQATGFGNSMPSEPRVVPRVEQSASISANLNDQSSRHNSQQFPKSPQAAPTPLKFQTGAVLFQMMETMGGTGTEHAAVGAYLDTYV